MELADICLFSAVPLSCTELYGTFQLNTGFTASVVNSVSVAVLIEKLSIFTVYGNSSNEMVMIIWFHICIKSLTPGKHCPSTLHLSTLT